MRQSSPAATPDANFRLVSLQALRVASALSVLAAVGAFAIGSPASAASRCPTQTFLSFDHLAYASKRVPSTVRLAAGSSVASGAIDEPTSPDGCRRARESVQVLVAGPIEPRVAVMVGGRPREMNGLGAGQLEGTVGAHQEMVVGGGDVDHAVAEPVTLLRLLHVQPGPMAEDLGKMARVVRVEVLEERLTLIGGSPLRTADVVLASGLRWVASSARGS